MNKFNRPLIDTSRWLRRDDDRRRTMKLAGDHELLLVAAGEGPGGRIYISRTHVELVDGPTR